MLLGGARLADLPRPVRLLGWASFFTDAATEMIYPLLPLYLSRVLGAGAVSLGVIEGVAEGVNSLLKIVSGRLSDRWSRRKPIVVAGYLLSSLARPFIGISTGWTQVLAIRAIDRTGKGIRGAPRDAMLAEFATPSTRGVVYGFHRAMDHAGAVVGPLVASAFLLAWPGHYQALFLLTIVPGALAVWTLLKVPEGRSPRITPHPQTPPPDSRHTAGNGQSRIANAERAVAGDLPASGARLVASPRRSGRLPARLWAVLAIVMVFSLGNSADAFLLLRLSTALGHDAYLPLLWSALHVVKASLSVYGGALSDRVGRQAVIVAGWCVYAIVYLGFAAAESAGPLVGLFLGYGVYFGLAEGAEKALVADLAPADRTGAAFGVYYAALGIGALLASVVFGVLYERFGHGVAFTTGAALAALAAVLLAGVRTDKQ